MYSGHFGKKFEFFFENFENRNASEIRIFEKVSGSKSRSKDLWSLPENGQKIYPLAEIFFARGITYKSKRER